MFDVFGSVKSLLKLDSVCIDNNVFRLHYKATVIILVAFSLLVTSRQYIGDPIDCIVDSSIGGDIMDTYCWIHSTYTVPDKYGAKIGSEVAHPGVGPVGAGRTDQVKYHKYYQWVCFVLFFQAILFYVPRYLWKTWEGGRLKMLALDLNCPIVDEDNKCQRKKLLLDYFVSNIKNHNFYAYRFFFCEVLNFINCVGQIFFMDMFLGYEFTTYGTKVLSFTEQDPYTRNDPMDSVFPKVTKCTFNKYGPSGSIVQYDGLCVLPLNIVNEKIYVFLWFWFIIVSVISGVALIYRLVTILGPQVRNHLLRSKARLADPKYINIITNKCQVGDWFILYQLGRNVDPMIYRELMHDLAMRLDGRDLVA